MIFSPEVTFNFARQTQVSASILLNTFHAAGLITPENIRKAEVFWYIQEI